MYAVASSSGSIFFALNFGDEGKEYHPHGLNPFEFANIHFQEGLPSKLGFIELVSFKARIPSSAACK